MSFPTPNTAAVTALAPTGTLRAAINLSNFLLVSSVTDDGTPIGVSPDMAGALASALGVPIEFQTYPNPGDVADAAQTGAWDVGNIGADPARAEFIEFTDAYAEIESTYLVPAGSPITSFVDADQPGIRISVKERAAYALWLERNLEHATLIESESLDSSFDVFIKQRLEALAGLRPRLVADAERLPGSRVLPGKFSAVQQAIGTPNDRDGAGIAYLRQFVEAAKASGVVADLIETHGATGLSVAPLATD
ncbi:MAG: transporter substrate-binding domain-containing protein [Acidimicrobiaceae bacterium]|jgi:polar amino acid transport system substrate-binding protein|nr:transporter substrate-binding domain-containing protein [Acidimicrobiaceae bacterium]MBT5580613.1 transporter substrate-binding domain-containing protein [Acidimicrobiaceae bacterium]MBT5850235.1 transporter substrate-binding domain-containing protein [Acidimicrobiaceae bacterium]